MQIESSDGSAYKLATVRLVTLSGTALFGGHKFETYLYEGNAKKLLEHYDTLEDAIDGHSKFTNEMGLTQL